MRLTHTLRDYGIERWAGLLTWAMLAAISLWLMTKRPEITFGSPLWLLVLGLFVVFIMAFSWATRDAPIAYEPITRYLLLVVQLASTYLLFWLLPFNFLAVLITMWCAQLPYFFSVRMSVVIAALVNVPFAFIFQLHWGQSGAWLTALLFWAFHMFAILMMASQLREVQARQREQAINRELRATQALLTEANKQQERTRIARNIHDLLGHHLTALAIQLQVAERKSDGEVQHLLKQSQSIAKLLLADVREAVSDIRSASEVPLAQIVRELVYEVPGKQIELDIPSSLQIPQMEVADAVVRIVQEGITNFVRHSKGLTLMICIRRLENKLALELKDNGSPPSPLVLGNGLSGMQARAQALGGEFSLQTDNGLRIFVCLPLEDQCQ